MDGTKELFMIFSVEKFGEQIFPENKLSEGKQAIIEKLQRMKGEGFCVSEKEEYLNGRKREVNLLKTFHESSPERRVIEISTLLGKETVENPERF